MSVYSLTKGSEHALKLLALTGGNDTLLLIHPAREIRAEIQVQPAAEQKLEAALRLREQRHSMTLQTGDSANAQHLADWVEAIANGTLDTAQAIPQRQSVLLPCCRCEGEAIAYCYLAPAPAQHDLHGVKCRHRDCQSLEGVATAAAAADAWNAIQREELAEVAEPGPAQHEPLYVTHGPLIRNAIGLLSMRRPVAPDVQQVIDDLEMMLKGMPAPSAPAEAHWLEVAEVAAPIAQTEQRFLSAGQRLYDELRQWMATEHDPDSQAALQAWREAISQTGPLPDEQAAFDAWYVTPEAFKAGDHDGWRGIAWVAWQARAALASAPAA
ncbi:hypothetical protein [Stutzerimonas degradans]|uniref:hypothetical protein n=1 Tax=Stutzerimonas degradans TaxID=2968968 RepID=UPI001424365A|nr:hypothetical protein [Stutzerimonas degradans]NHW01954.1 hypothetical protein [Stutzerimonas degradans]